ncbi:MAG: GNAT family N-acetyltransferase [Spirulina sp.]
MLDFKKVSFRPATDADVDFLRELYRSTRIEEVDGWGIYTPEQRDAFLESQFYAQKTHYDRYFSEGRHDIILWENEPIGRFYIYDRESDRVRLIDIALLPQYRNQGIGTQLIQQLQARVVLMGKPLRLYVENFNPARRLYERLGFSYLEGDGGYLQMEWTPKTASTSS